MADDDKIETSMTAEIAFWRLLYDQGVVKQTVLGYPYSGSGTYEDPYAVKWIPDDSRNAMNFCEAKKRLCTILVAIATLAVSLVSSAYTRGVEEFSSNFTLGVKWRPWELRFLFWDLLYLLFDFYRSWHDTNCILCRLGLCFGLL